MTSVHSQCSQEQQAGLTGIISYVKYDCVCKVSQRNYTARRVLKGGRFVLYFQHCTAQIRLIPVSFLVYLLV